MFTLYTTLLSANGRKALAVTHHLGLHPEVRMVNVYKGEGREPEYLAKNPWGKIPTLVDGDLVLWESNAILHYIAEAHGDFRLSSRDPKARADILRWMFWESAHWQPTLTRLLADRAGQILFPGPTTEPRAQVAWADPAFLSLAMVLESELSARPFLSGSELTLADFSVAGMATYFRAAEFPFEEYPAIAAWYARIEELDAWRMTATRPWDDSARGAL